MPSTTSGTDLRSPASLRFLRIAAMLCVLVLCYSAILKLLPSAGADQGAAPALAGTMAGWLESETPAQARTQTSESHFPAESPEVYPGQIDWTPLPPGTRAFE